MAKLGILTIGQTPRPDITDDLAQLLPPEIQLAEFGVLDGMTPRQVREELGYTGGELLVTRMGRQKEQVRLSGGKVMVRMQDCIRRAQRDGADVLLLACTGVFPDYEHRVPLLRPDACQREQTAALAAGRPVGVLIPNESQRDQIAGWWSFAGVGEPLVAVAEPFSGNAEEAVRAAQALKVAGACVLCMDCFGYTLLQQQAAAKATGLPTVLPRQVLAEQAMSLLKEEV